MSIIPCLLGAALWLGATLLLTEDALRSGHLTITHGLQPLLTAGTVAAAVWVHKARWLAKPAFLVLAVIGSLATLYGTLGRQATARDDTEATIQATNRNYGDKTTELKAAKVEQAKECRTIGKRCEAWNARVSAHPEATIRSLTLGTASGACSMLCVENPVAAVAVGVLVFAASRAAFDVPGWLRSRRYHKEQALEKAGSNVWPN